ncbi:hypothetical protein [Rickettsia rickettsii]|nr:hypothetical protein [Rickettsia rickettsii]AFB28898.1 RND family efflux transporter [Rickettsia rickettsii str. Hlp\
MTEKIHKTGKNLGISEIFIKRPVLATLFMATILLFGAFGYRI